MTLSVLIFGLSSLSPLPGQLETEGPQKEQPGTSGTWTGLRRLVDRPLCARGFQGWHAAQ